MTTVTGSVTVDTTTYRPATTCTVQLPPGQFGMSTFDAATFQ